MGTTPPATPSAPASHSFRLHHTLASRVLMFMPMLMFGAGLVAGAVLLVRHGPVMPGIMIFPVWLGIAAFISTHYLRLAHTIDWSAHGMLTFHSYLGQKTLRPQQILAIEPVQNTLGILQVRHASGKVLLLNQFDGFHEFLARLKAANPSVQLSGC